MKKKKITSLVLVLVVAMSMTVGASAASYIPDDVTYQNLNGQQLAIKTYTLLPDQDPADLYEEDFEHDGFLYSMPPAPQRTPRKPVTPKCARRKRGMSGDSG